MRSKQERLRGLLRVVQATEPSEIDCDEFLVRVAPFLEALTARHDIPDQLRQVAQHLSVCPECKEEFDALLRAHEIEP
jgi:hypothetical protein